MEHWKDVVGAEEHYQISDFGRVKIKHTGDILKPSRNGRYMHIELRYGVNRNFLIHRMVAEAFIPNPFGLRCVNHKDENKQNNNLDNLEWCTYQYNARYGKGSLARNSKVIQYDMAGNALKIWDSIKDASEALNLKYQNISRCCRNERKSSGGFMWSFANLEDIRKYAS